MKRAAARAPVALGCALALLGACAADMEHETEQSPEVESIVELTDAQSALISDARNGGGKAGFFFLPPVVPTLPRTSGAFEARLAPEVSVDELDNSGNVRRTVATYQGKLRTREEQVRRNVKAQFYVARLRSAKLALDPARTYRVRVSVAGRALGFADLDVVSSAKEAKKVDRTRLVPLVVGDTLAFRFRVEKSAVDADGDGVFDWLDNCPSVSNPPASVPADIAPSSANAPAGCDPEQTDCDPAEQDVNPISAVAQPDADTDGIGDACDTPSEPSHYHYVISAARYPSNGTEAQAWGLDLDGNGSVNNQLASVFGSLGALTPGLDLSSAPTIDRGVATTLLDLRTTSLVSAGAISFTSYVADRQITPAPCADASDNVCRRHLTGSGVFAIDANVPRNAPLSGTTTAGVTSSPIGSARLTLPLTAAPLGGVIVELRGARIYLPSASPDAINGGIIAGALSPATVRDVILPALTAGRRAEFARDCVVGSSVSGCECVAGSRGATQRNLFDKTPADCQISDAEVSNVMSGFLTPDVTVDGERMLSVGFSFDAVRASFRE